MEIKAILQRLKGTKEPDGEPGEYVREFTKSKSQKDRRHDGRVEARFVNPKMKYKEAHAEAIEPVEYWDEWITRRDGFRDKFAHLIKADIKQEQSIRKAKKLGKLKES